MRASPSGLTTPSVFGTAAISRPSCFLIGTIICFLINPVGNNESTSLETGSNSLRCTDGSDGRFSLIIKSLVGEGRICQRKSAKSPKRLFSVGMTPQAQPEVSSQQPAKCSQRCRSPDFLFLKEFYRDFL